MDCPGFAFDDSALLLISNFYCDTMCATSSFFVPRQENGTSQTQSLDSWIAHPLPGAYGLQPTDLSDLGDQNSCKRHCVHGICLYFNLSGQKVILYRYSISESPNQRFLWAHLRKGHAIDHRRRIPVGIQVVVRSREWSHSRP
jgi:hypothetical protein